MPDLLCPCVRELNLNIHYYLYLSNFLNSISFISVSMKKESNVDKKGLISLYHSWLKCSISESQNQKYERDGHMTSTTKQRTKDAYMRACSP